MPELDKPAALTALNEAPREGPLHQIIEAPDMLARIQAAAMISKAIHVVYDCVIGLFLEKEAPANADPVSTSLAARLEAILSSQPGERREVLGSVGGQPDASPFEELTLSHGAALRGRSANNETGGYSEVPGSTHANNRHVPTTFPRSTVDPADAAVGEASLWIAPAKIGPPPDQRTFLAGTELIKTLGRDVVPLYTEGGELLGAMPTFGENITQVHAQTGHTMSVGWLALRVVVVPYNQGIDPRTIAGFIPVAGLPAGPVNTGPTGQTGRRLILPDIAEPV